jgi:hypothetical protein
MSYIVILMSFTAIFPSIGYDQTLLQTKIIPYFSLCTPQKIFSTHAQTRPNVIFDTIYFRFYQKYFNYILMRMAEIFYILDLKKLSRLLD